MIDALFFLIIMFLLVSSISFIFWAMRRGGLFDRLFPGYFWPRY
jgi:hypothetical protein